MDFEDPFSAVSPGVHGRVLTVLSRTDAPLTGRVIAGLVHPKASTTGVQRVLDDLVRQGLVVRDKAGSAYLYLLNRQHLAASAVVALASMRLELLNRIEAVVTAWTPPPEAVWVFGSVARGESGPDSDLDLVLVRPDGLSRDDDEWRDRVDDLASAVYAWTGNACDILDFDANELEEMDRRGERLLDELRRGAFAVTGYLPRELMASRSSR